MLPNAITRLACSAVNRRRFHSHYVESLFHALERFVSKQSFDGNLCIVDESWHLVLLIAFGKESYVYALCGVFSLQKSFVRSYVALTNMANQNV